MGTPSLEEEFKDYGFRLVDDNPDLVCGKLAELLAVLRDEEWGQLSVRVTTTVLKREKRPQLCLNSLSVIQYN